MEHPTLFLKAFYQFTSRVSSDADECLSVTKDD